MAYEFIEAGVTLASGIVALAVAIMAFAVAPKSMAHRTLAFVLLLEGGFWLLPQGVAGFAWAGLETFPNNGVQAGISAAMHLAWSAVGWAYILFGIYGVEWSPMQKLRNRYVVGLVFIAMAVSAVLQFNALRAWQHRGELWKLGSVEVVMLPDIVKGASSLAVLVLIIFSVRELSRTGQDSGRAKAMLWAFGVRDLVWVGFTIWYFFIFGLDGHDAVSRFMFLLLFASHGIYAFMVGRAIMQGKILDVHHRVHIVVQRGTVAAIFVAVFVGVQTLVSEYFTATGGLTAGAIAAAGLVFALTPLQNLANRIANSTVPKGAAEMQMSIAQREAFYRDQVQIAYSDGAFGVKERKTLRSVRERLGISGDDALRIEDAVAGAEAN